MMNVVLVLAEVLVLCWCWYRVGRSHERRDMRHENGWWDGFRHGCSHREKQIQAIALEHGIVMNFETGKPPKRN